MSQRPEDRGWSRQTEKGRYGEPCLYCGREADECICHLAPDFPDDPDPILDNSDDWDWDLEDDDYGHLPYGRLPDD